MNGREGASIGGECEECKALWINREEYITELPPCKLLHKNKKDEFICGEPSTDGAGEFGMCILEGYDPPGFNCPISSFYKLFYELKSTGKDLQLVTIKVNGREYKVFRAYNIVLL